MLKKLSIIILYTYTLSIMAGGSQSLESSSGIGSDVGVNAVKEAAKGVAVAGAAVATVAKYASGAAIVIHVVNKTADHYSPENEAKREDNRQKAKENERVNEHRDAEQKKEQEVEQCFRDHAKDERNGKGIPRACEGGVCDLAVVAGVAKAREKTEAFKEFAPEPDQQCKECAAEEEKPKSKG